MKNIVILISGRGSNMQAIVEADIPSLRLTGRMLIEAVSLTLRGGAQRAQLSLVSPEAYSPEPVLIKKLSGEDPWGSEGV